MKLSPKAGQGIRPRTRSQIRTIAPNGKTTKKRGPYRPTIARLISPMPQSPRLARRAHTWIPASKATTPPSIESRYQIPPIVGNSMRNDSGSPLSIGMYPIRLIASTVPTTATRNSR